MPGFVRSVLRTGSRPDVCSPGGARLCEQVLGAVYRRAIGVGSKGVP